ncbi:MAG TPA: hypothetical protein VH206_20910 [Xanthobacteraceae bacterium]|jgi:hypothetical protein|nr:hypothetical protein [Xanthobacteraceae bacterium]
MDETTFVSGTVARAPVASSFVGAWSGISWSAVIAGAVTAVAVSIIVISLGTGIGMVLVSPYSYSSPSAGTMTVIGALWLVFAQACGFATGGYVAGRLRRPPAAAHDNEVKFRDGANGLVVWAIGVIVASFVVAGAVEKIGSVAGTAGSVVAGAAVGGAAAGQPQAMAYYTDILLRPNAQSGGAANTGGAGNAGAGSSENASAQNNNGNANNNTMMSQRAQVGRILVMSLGPNGIGNDDRAYLAQIVSAQSGISQDDAQKRVDDVIARVKRDTTQAADAARKAAAYVSFWTFMSLLFGAVCATLGGVLGGDLRDEYALRGLVTQPR